MLQFIAESDAWQQKKIACKSVYLRIWMQCHEKRSKQERERRHETRVGWMRVRDYKNEEKNKISPSMRQWLRDVQAFKTGDKRIEILSSSLYHWLHQKWSQYIIILSTTNVNRRRDFDSFLCAVKFLWVASTCHLLFLFVKYSNFSSYFFMHCIASVRRANIFNLILISITNWSG